ncbi:hypothetical protein, partial [Pseudomonas syringae group genomosp. 3]|uniref:hypothetical protein n=1 Tax=Pseudomonas syringae group genomosp. 3 TaxID=251701 RepID=UPI001E60791C
SVDPSHYGCSLMIVSNWVCFKSAKLKSGRADFRVTWGIPKSDKTERLHVVTFFVQRLCAILVTPSLRSGLVFWPHLKPTTGA